MTDRSHLSRRALLGGLLAVPAASTLAASPAAAATSRPIRMFVWDSRADFLTGSRSGSTVTTSGALQMDATHRQVYFADPQTGIRRSCDVADWTSPVVSLGMSASQLIASWDARTPTGTFVELAIQGFTSAGTGSRWYIMGRWTLDDTSRDLRRASATGQSDAFGFVDTDTLKTGTSRFTRARLQVRLRRPGGSTITPTVSLAGLMASALPSTLPATSRTLGTGTVVPVPTYSQMLHSGHLPQYDGGGEAWCSATSTAMLLDYWKVGPSRTETAWVTIAGETRPQVDHAARYCYDYAYRGTGNWPFNTAYAASRGLRAYVTRLRSLTEAERFTAAGIPLAVSVSFAKGALPGANYGTNGHLMVLCGFTKAGDVVVNDPAASTDSGVRRTYPRAQFEKAWLQKSGGLVYLMHPVGRTLPAALSTEPNWG